MASSLEELLAEEGFRGRRSGMASRASFKAEAVIKSLPPSRGKAKADSPLGFRTKTERARSDVSRYNLRGESPSCSSRRPRDNFVPREKIVGRSKMEFFERLGRQVSNDVQNNKVANSEKIQESEIIEIGHEEDEGVNDIHSDKPYSSERSETSRQGNDRNRKIMIDGRQSSNYNRDFPKYKASRDSNEKSLRPHNLSYDSSVRSSMNVRNFKGDDGSKRGSVSLSQAVSELALDEVAVKAMISILIGYIKRFLKDGEFRSVLRHNCFSSLDFDEYGEGNQNKSKVITNLEQAIEIVEKAAEEATSTKDLKRALLQLSVIKTLNSNDLKDGQTSGIRNSRVSACANIYLSVIQKLQKKDRASSRYLLQVFCDSPFSARTILLPELWEYLFFPHLSHLKEWYNQEAGSLLNTPSKTRKLRLLDNVYNEILNSGTYQFAVYYKDWLTDGVETPSLPSIDIPTVSIQNVEQIDSIDHFPYLSRSPDLFSPKPMVSKKLYEAVFSHSSKPGCYEVEDVEETYIFDDGVANSDGSASEVKNTITCSSEIVEYLDQDGHDNSCKAAEDKTFLSDNALTSVSNEEWKLVKVITSPENDLNDEISNSHRQLEPAVDANMLTAFSHSQANESILMSLTKSVFELQQSEDSRGTSVSSLSYYCEIKEMTSYEDLDGTCEDFDKGSLLASVPQSFICPLSGQLFEDPVTIETGQTFEKEAIRVWFNKGNRTCPITGKTLECPTVPFTNFILKRVIDSWKLEHCSHLLALASRIINNPEKHESRRSVETDVTVLEKLLTTFGREESLANAKHLVSLGGLDFLIKKITFEDLEEKIRVAALLSFCIEADASCRNHIAKNVDKQCLLELLYSKQPKSRGNAVLLLIELLCRNRRKDVKLILSDLQNKEIMNTMHVLLMYLQNSPLEQKPWVAVLLLHFDLMGQVEHQKYSIYREEAVDAIVMALEGSLTDEKVREKSCTALHALGGHFSASGKSLTEHWMLKQAGFSKIYELNSPEEDLVYDDDSLSLEDEEEAIDEWQRNLSISLLGNGKKSFLGIISKCLGSGNSDLMTACLTTVAWLSRALSALPHTQFHLTAFSALISALKQSLENARPMDHRVLASLSLLNFSKFPECRILLMTIGEEIGIPLQRLVEVTWTARQLNAIISGQYH
ncbi:putative E3 ubiquitin-protein ligase LIN-2 isoform X2 [Mercurialis annua]|uniref:putative E3 ubiquitin-protein ligase LIN-2 isoform X2 n=1 Tax=Mercurialis annua TaxID=3986 RepID=UPI00215E01A3|nr:putative E3 ubiquitin-protein ligase LIN-2 isoform X2 [Mercurialis annua]